MATTFDRPATGAPPGFEPARLHGFMTRVMGDLSGAITGILCALGDRLGLFGALAMSGPTTSDELAGRTGLDERYLREWLRALASAGYLEYDPTSERFYMPPEHMPVLAQEGGPLFLGGGFQQLLGLIGPIDALAEAFRSGQGIPESAYPPDMRLGMERTSATWIDHALVQQWVASVPGLSETLSRGARAADLGCGSGRALIALARAFPSSRFDGYDLDDAAIGRAHANAMRADVASRVELIQHDVLNGLTNTYDLVIMLDALHDFTDPARVLDVIRAALRPGGVLLLVEIQASERVEENRGPIGSLMYGTSVLYCLPTSRTHGGMGLGTMGLPESRIRALCREAGFGSVERVQIQNPVNALYLVRP